MSYYSIEFRNHDRFLNKSFFTDFKEKISIISADKSKIIKILFPHIITILGIVFYNWNLSQIIFVYLFDYLFANIFEVIKTFINQNEEILKGVYISNVFTKVSGAYQGNLNGLKKNVIVFNLFSGIIFSYHLEFLLQFYLLLTKIFLI